MIQLVPTGAPKDKYLALQESDFTYDANIAQLACAPLRDQTSDVAIEDYDVLLSAVKARLRRTADECLTSTTDPQEHDTVARVQASVLECVVALDQLHITLTHELARRQHLELEVFELQNALAQVHTELIRSAGIAMCPADDATTQVIAKRPTPLVPRQAVSDRLGFNRDHANG